MTSIRARFTRGEGVKYISHLDLMKVFGRALRRARIPIAYSQGFNPHPQMVFGLPLSVGVTSEAEYADFDLAEDMETDVFIEKLNAQLPSGLRISEAKRKNNKYNIMASIAEASYEVLVYSSTNMGITEFIKIFDELLHRDEIIAEKETKSGKKMIDIKPLIHKAEILPLDELQKKQECGEQASVCIGDNCGRVLDYYKKMVELGDVEAGYSAGSLFFMSALLSAGSAANLKPELLVSAIGEAAGVEVRTVKVHRTGLYISFGGRIIEPLDETALSG